MQQTLHHEPSSRLSWHTLLPKMVCWHVMQVDVAVLACPAGDFVCWHVLQAMPVWCQRGLHANVCCVLNVLPAMDTPGHFLHQHQNEHVCCQHDILTMHSMDVSCRL